MRVVWTAAAWADVYRLYAFQAEHDLDVADRVFDSLLAAPEALMHFPRRGTRLQHLASPEIREYRFGRYLLRYEVAGTDILVLRFFHGREERA